MKAAAMGVDGLELDTNFGSRGTTRLSSAVVQPADRGGREEGGYAH